MVFAAPDQSPDRHRRSCSSGLIPAYTWTLDVLNIVRSLGKDEFSLAEVYQHADALARLHRGNRHVRDKIRQ